MDPVTLLVSSFLSYLISLAAGLRNSAIDAQAQKRLEKDLHSIGLQVQDRKHSQSFTESLEIIPIDVAKLKHRLQEKAKGTGTYLTNRIRTFIES